MNRLEFNEVVKILGIEETTKKVKKDITETVYVYQDIEFYFDGFYCTKVQGKIPYEVGNRIYEKYPNNSYAITIDNGTIDNNPFYHAIDDEYVSEVQEYVNCKLDMNTYLKQIHKSRLNLRNRPNENKYLTAYRIGTKEGLIIFLIEIKNYYARKNNLQEIANYEELLKQVNIELLQIINPTVSNYDWMIEDDCNKEVFLKTMEEEVQLFRIKLREEMNQFDKAVNPFLENNLDGIDQVNLSLVNIDIYEKIENTKKYPCCNMQINQLESYNNVVYYRRPNGFSYHLKYKINEKYYLEVSHYFASSKSSEEKGEVIYISQYGYDFPKKIELRYNLTYNIANNNGTKIPANKELLDFVYETIKEATSYAKEVTQKEEIKKYSLLSK